MISLKNVCNFLNSEKETKNNFQKNLVEKRNNNKNINYLKKEKITSLSKIQNNKNHKNLNIKSHSPQAKKSNLNNNKNIQPNISLAKNNLALNVFSKDKVNIKKKNQVSNLSEYSKKMDFIMNTVKKLSRNLRKENRNLILQDINSRNKQNLRINSHSKNSNMNNIFSTNSNTFNSERTQNNNISEYLDKKILGDSKPKLKLNLIQQEDEIKTDRINFDKKFYERFKIEVKSIDFINEKNIQIDKQLILEKGKTYIVLICENKLKFA